VPLKIQNAQETATEKPFVPEQLHSAPVPGIAKSCAAIQKLLLTCLFVVATPAHTSVMFAHTSDNFSADFSDSRHCGMKGGVE
jgi:hypothetical protein